MNAFNGKCHFSKSSSSGTPEPIFKKNLHSWLRPWPHPTSKNLVQSAQRGRVCACVKLSSSGVYFLGFFSFRLIATGPPVGPIIVVNGLNDAFWWHAHSLYGLINKNWNLPPLTPKFENLHYGLWQLRRAITRAPLKIRARCLHQTGGFQGRAIKWYYSNFR